MQQKLLDAAMLFTIGALVLLSIVSMAALTTLSRYGSDLVGHTFGPGVHLLFAVGSVLVPILLLFGAFTLLYWLVPHAEVKLKHVWPGALAAAVIFEVVQLLFAFYVANLGHYSKTYGTLGGIIAFLFFIYIAANVILLGAEISKEYIDITAGTKPEQDPETAHGKRDLLGQAKDIAKGLVVDDSRHHDTSEPYQPLAKSRSSLALRLCRILKRRLRIRGHVPRCGVELKPGET